MLRCPGKNEIASRAAWAAIALLALPITAVLAGKPIDDRVLAREGGSYEQRLADQTRCATVAKAAPASDLPQAGARAAPNGYAADIPTAVGGAIAFGIIALIDTHQARGRAQAFCLLNLGYAFVPLTSDETAAYGPLQGARRDTWERTFLSGSIDARITAVRAPVVPPLPAYRDEIATQGGLRVVLPSLIVSDAGVDGIVIKGKLERSRTAVLTAAFRTTDGPIQVAGEAGAVFHQVDYRPQQTALLRDQGATWCGPVTQYAGDGPGAPDVYCFSSHLEGYDPFRPSGYTWLAGPYRDGIFLARMRQPIRLRERERDDIGTLDLKIKVVAIASSNVVLAAYAMHSDRKVMLWQRRLRLDATGSAVLSLWTQRAVIKRADPQHVVVSIDEHGDGHGWREGD
jgi:hypothetical protein